MVDDFTEVPQGSDLVMTFGPVFILCSGCSKKSGPREPRETVQPPGWIWSRDGAVMKQLCGTCQTPTKVLSLRQPWAHLVLHAGKNVENRKWNTKLRGAFFIHASLGATEADWDYARRCADLVDPSIRVPRLEELPHGGIIGRATLVDVIKPCYDKKHLDKIRLPTPETCSHPWHIPWQYGFVLEDIRPLDFVPMKGALNFFRDPRLPKVETPSLKVTV